MPGMTNNNNRCCFPADFISMWNDARKKKVATKVKQTPPTGLAGSTEGGDTESISPGEQQSTGIPTLPQRCAIQRNVRLFTGLKDRSFPASPPDNGSSGSSQTQGTFLSNQFVKDKVYKKKKSNQRHRQNMSHHENFPKVRAVMAVSQEACRVTWEKLNVL